MKDCSPVKNCSPAQDRGPVKASESCPRLARLATASLAGTSVLPIRWTQTLGQILGALGSRIPNQQRAITRLNLQLCFPDAPAQELDRLTRRSLQETTKTALELGAMWRWPTERLMGLEDGVEGEALLQRSLAADRGTLLLTPHLGNWEFLNHFLMRRGQLVCLYRPPRIAELEAYVLKARSRTGCIPAPASRVGVRRVFKALRGGDLVLILPDQEPLKAHGVRAPFFGMPALTMTLVARILRRTGAQPLFVFAQRQPSGRFRVRFVEAPDGMADACEIQAATQLNAGVEACVRQCPEQYLWTYKRFKTAPPGEPTPYRVLWSKRKQRRIAAARSTLEQD